MTAHAPTPPRRVTRASTLALRVPVRTTFRHMPSSAALSARIEAEAQKLRRYYDRITRCHVVILAPHRHRRRGRPYAIHLELTVPRSRIVIRHEPAAGVPLAGAQRKASEVSATDKDIYALIRTAFDAARRQLEDYARRLRGDVKRHERVIDED